MPTFLSSSIRPLLIGSTAFLLLASGFAHAAGEEKPFKLSHSPKQPKSGEAVTITVTAPRTAAKINWLLQYQVVEPGKYIDLSDPAYEQDWKDVGLTAPAGEDPRKARVVLSGVLPGDIQKNRRLIRYRMYSPDSRSVVAPAKEDTQRNFAYFVYDGIPEWRAAINPSGQPAERKVTTFSKEVMRSIQAYHLIARREAVENVTWRERKSFGSEDRHDYNYTATLVSDGEVYDHVPFRARGGNWRYAMGKNMWKIDFNKGEHLKARDNHGRRYETKWNKLNLGACIQQADYGMRGEHGLFEAVAYRLFNVGGVEAPHTHWAQLRIVDSHDESPADQYTGDFWGLYLATEEVDEDFLKEHALPDGNLYKMDFGMPKPEHISTESPADASDVQAFIRNIRLPQKTDWWRTNVDLDRYYSYRAIVESVHHYDIGQGKNYFFYNNPKTRRWQVIPWDVDLTWADHMYGNGAEPFFRAGILRTEPFKGEYLRRLAEIRDLLFNPEQTGALIDEYAAVICDPSGKESIVHADRAKWDHHPIMSSKLATPGKADPGRFYESSPTGDFPGMVKLMKEYVQKRGQWIDETLLAGAAFAPIPSISFSGKVDASAARIKVQLSPAKSVTEAKWRLSAVGAHSTKTQPGRKSPGVYEIATMWETTGGSAAEVPTDLLKQGDHYRIRACYKDRQGRWSRWSAPLEFTFPNTQSNPASKP